MDYCGNYWYSQQIKRSRVLKLCLHDTTGCQTGCQTVLTTCCIAYTNIQPVVQPVVWIQPVWFMQPDIQPVHLFNRFDNRLYRVNGVLQAGVSRCSYSRWVARSSNWVSHSICGLVWVGASYSKWVAGNYSSWVFHFEHYPARAPTITSNLRPLRIREEKVEENRNNRCKT